MTEPCNCLTHDWKPYRGTILQCRLCGVLMTHVCDPIVRTITASQSLPLSAWESHRMEVLK